MTARTLITFVLDRSGSMSSILEPTIAGFNSYVKEMKASSAMIEFKLMQFDSEGITETERTPMQWVEELNTRNFIPRAATPLYDAVGRAILDMRTEIDRRTEAARKRDNGTLDEFKPVICVQTDGYENASREWNIAGLRAEIDRLQKLGWQFNFMGAGIDAYNQGSSMGFQRGGTISYDPLRSHQMFAGLAQSTAAYAQGATATVNFSAGVKRAAGDQYDKEATG